MDGKHEKAEETTENVSLYLNYLTVHSC